jgi:hypothetical protein
MTKNLYNLTILNPQQKRELVLEIVGAVGWQSGSHSFEDDSVVGRLLTSLKLQLWVDLSIKPELTVYRADVPRTYSKVEIDVRKFPEGNPFCQHTMVELYWEVGGGMMDDGVPHRYVMCSKCGYHDGKPLSPITWWTKFRTAVHRAWIGA